MAENKNLTRFTIHDDGTVTDTKTGLMWKRCAEGQTGEDCSGGEAQKFTWEEAMEHVENVNFSGGFANYQDWRVPTIDELESIIAKKYKPTIDRIAFPNTSSGFFWSSSIDAENDKYAWFVSFRHGNASYANVRRTYHVDTHYYYVRLVRGGE